MADQSSSSSGAEPSVTVVPQEATNIVFDEAEVKALRQQGVDAEKADNWSDAAEFYSRALEKACPDMNDMSAVVARGFDPLLANLFYLYGTALLYTYITTTSMFGDAAQKNVNEVATTMDENTEGDAALVEMLLQELAGGGEEGEEVAIQNKPTSDPVLTAGGGKVSAKEEEEETIDADQEADRQAREATSKQPTASGSTKMEKTETKKVKEPEEEEEETKQSTANADEEAEQQGEEGEEGEEEEEEEEGEEGEEGEAQEAQEEEPKENDLELAWQVLEIARVLYATQGSTRSLEMSDVHFSLGSLAWEDEKPEEARIEFEKALVHAQNAKERRAQAQVLLMISSTHEAKQETEKAVETLESAKKLLQEEITKIRATKPRAPEIEMLQSTVKEIEERVFALQEKFTPAHPDDLKDLPDPNAPIKFSFKPPSGFQAPSGGFAKPSAAASAPTATVNTLQPKRKVPAAAAAPTTAASNNAMDTTPSAPAESAPNGRATTENGQEKDDLPEPSARQKRAADAEPADAPAPDTKKVATSL